MSDLIDTTEMYLRTIYELIEDGVVPMRARIAEQLGHSGPTVSQTVARMERDGLVVVSDGDHHLELTAEGKERATRVMRKHRLAERLLSDVIGLSLVHVHEEACRWEHVMSDLVEERVLSLLSDPLRSPYGNPIPALAELGYSGSAADIPALVSLEQAAVGGAGGVTIARLGEAAQIVPGLLDEAIAAGALPGASAHVGLNGDDVVLTIDGVTVAMDRAAARHVFVVSAPGSDTSPG